MKSKTRKQVGKRLTSNRRRRKSSRCLNCEAVYTEETNYCPACGQENNHNVASFGTVVVDFFHNYFSFDSKFSNSLKPFFLQPGHLTKQFVEGKRASFVNPIRLYLILSLAFFFVFSLISQDVIKQTTSITENKADLTQDITMDSVLLTQDSVLAAVNEEVSGPSYLKHPDSLGNDPLSKRVKIYWKIRGNKNLEVDQVMDSLHTDSLSLFQKTLVKKIIRIDRAEGAVVISHVLKNLPLMMILLIPIFALVLKALYIRSGNYYITHIVHLLHLHSFAYVIYGLYFMIIVYLLPENDFEEWILLLGWLVVLIYAYMSYLKVYHQKWNVTLFKYLISGFIYFLLLTFGVILELFYSVLSY